MDGKRYKYYRSLEYGTVLRKERDLLFCYFFDQTSWRMVSQIDLENEKYFEEIPEEELALMVLNNEI